MLLHLTDADGFDNGDQVPGRQAFDQSLRVIASMREPGKQSSCRLLWRHAVGFFKGYFTNALVIHRDFLERLSKFIRSGNPAQSEVTGTAFDPRADEPYDQPIRAFTSVAGLDTAVHGDCPRGQRWRGVRRDGCRKSKRARHTCRARRAVGAQAPIQRTGASCLRQRVLFLVIRISRSVLCNNF